MTIQRLSVAGLLLAAVGGLSVLVPAVAPAEPAGPLADAGRYALESSHARVLFSVSHAGLSTWYGEFPGAVGTLDLDPVHVERSRLDIMIKTAAITTTSNVLDDELRGPKWFDAQRFPEIRFTSRRIVRTSAKEASVAGDLTMHGVTKPVVLTARFNKAGINPFAKTYTVGFEVSGTIKRSDFGVSEDVPLVGDDVTLIISAPFEKKN